MSAASGDPVPAIYVADLPVTTEAANRAGREIWGYNKFVTAIDIKCDGKKFSATVRDHENELIGALEGTRGASAPAARRLTSIRSACLGAKSLRPLCRCRRDPTPAAATVSC